MSCKYSFAPFQNMYSPGGTVGMAGTGEQAGAGPAGPGTTQTKIYLL